MGIRRHIHRIWFRFRNGFDYRECWNLDVSLAAWLAPRLRYLSVEAHGAPLGYPSRDGSDTDYAAWCSDLAIAADRLEAYTNHWDIEMLGEERRVTKEASMAMQWVATWFGGLWD